MSDAKTHAKSCCSTQTKGCAGKNAETKEGVNEAAGCCCGPSCACGPSCTCPEACRCG